MALYDLTRHDRVGIAEEDSMGIGRRLTLGTCCTLACFALLLAQPRTGSAQEEEPLDAWGKDLFMTRCAVCHGEGGKGDGPAAAALKTRPADLTQLTKKHGGSFPRALIMQFIDGERPVPAHGPREMPVWGEVFRREKSDTEARMRIFALARFVESIQEQ
jgi:mono/diheme cytochrome c family protein